MTHNTDAVVLVHGLWLGRWSMAFIAQQLRRQGFRTYSFGYPTVRYALRENGLALRAFSDGIAGERIHFVGHSLGGVVIRAMLTYAPPARAGRIVTLGSPHQGSYVADQLARYRGGKQILGRSIADLCGGAMLSGCGGREIGVIQGDRPFGLGRMLFTLPTPNDGVVSMAEGELAGATDNITLPVAHSGMLLSRGVAAQTIAFLRDGRFRH